MFFFSLFAALPSLCLWSGECMQKKICLMRNYFNLISPTCSSHSGSTPTTLAHNDLSFLFFPPHFLSSKRVLLHALLKFVNNNHIFWLFQWRLLNESIRLRSNGEKKKKDATSVCLRKWAISAPLKTRCALVWKKLIRNQLTAPFSHFCHRNNSYI